MVCNAIHDNCGVMGMRFVKHILSAEGSRDVHKTSATYKRPSRKLLYNTKPLNATVAFSY